MRKQAFRKVLLSATLGSVVVFVSGCDAYAVAVLQNLSWGLAGTVAGISQIIQEWISGALVNGLLNLI